MKWSAGWGAACDPCAKAKTRCIRSKDANGADEARCNRCQSLNIACPQQVRKPRKRRVREATAGRNGTPNLSGSHGTPLDPNATTTEGARKDTVDLESDSSSPYTAPVKTHPAEPFTASTTLPGFFPFPSPTCTCVSDADGKDDPTPTESDETLLAIYRTRLSPQFPFVVIPYDVTAAELARTRPFLFKSIKMAASLRNRRSMWAQSRVLLKQISEMVFKGPGSRSLDLLQGVIVFLGFIHYFCLAHGNFNTLAHLASSMISDMRLDRPRARPAPRNKGVEGMDMDPEEPRTMMNDERRAILAVWYLNSSYAVAFKKVNSPGRHFTQLMERLTQDLQEKPEYESDKDLAQLVCSQRLNEMIAQLQMCDQTVDIRPSSSAWGAKLDGLLADLGRLRVLDDQQRHPGYMTSSHYTFAMLQLLEPQILEADHAHNFPSVAALRNTPAYFHTPVESKDWKIAADTALRAWYDVWLTIPVCHFFYMPMSAYLHLTHATMILLRRARLALLTRHRQRVAAGAQDAYTSMKNSHGSDDLMLDLLDRLASRFQDARKEMAAAHCYEWANDFLDLVSWKLRERKACIEKWVALIAEYEARESPNRGGGELWTESFGPTIASGGMEGDLTAFQAMEPGLWLDPLEAMLMGGGDAQDNWF